MTNRILSEEERIKMAELLGVDVQKVPGDIDLVKVDEVADEDLDEEDEIDEDEDEDEEDDEELEYEEDDEEDEDDD